MVFPLFGRGPELGAVAQALDAALTGAGSAWLLTGEGGIGKSRLCEEIALGARERRQIVLWGRCWEAGGAPAYWPWIQILREIPPGLEGAPGGEAALFAAQKVLARLLPPTDPTASTEAGPGSDVVADEIARFHLLDEITRALGAAARQRALVIFLEDLHAADTSSVLLLEFLAGQVRQLPLVVVGTYREAEASRRPVGPLLSRLYKVAQGLALRRLGQAEVEGLLKAQAGGAVAPETAARVYATTEGNPLFVVETARLLRAEASAPPAAHWGAPPPYPAAGANAGSPPSRAAGVAPVPPTIKTALRARVASVSPPAHEALRAAAVIGRDFSQDTLVEVSGVSVQELGALLEEAAAADLIGQSTPGVFRFSHVLLRETLYQDLPEDERAALHRAVAAALPEEAAFEIAHHLVAAGLGGPKTIRACVRAAELALGHLAYDEASSWYSAALSALGGGAGDDEKGALERARLLIGRGHARLHAGRVAEGKNDCYQAAEIARQQEHPDTLAQAALECGALYVVAHVDPKLVALLSEALAALAGRTDALAARVMARLAAAQQPAPDPRGPIVLAEQAVQMARALDDPRALLETIRAAGSTMVDLAPAEERLLLDREHVALAESLGDDGESFRGSARLVFDCYELGDRLGAQAAIEACDACAQRLGHPRFAWRVAALRAMVAMSEGDFTGAEALRRQASRLGEAARDDQAPCTLGMQGLTQLALQGRDNELLLAVPQVERLFAGSPTALPVAKTLAAALLARVGRVEDALLHLEPGHLDRLIDLGDRSLLTSLAELAHGLGDPEAAARIRHRLSPSTEHYQHGGLFSMTWNGPTSRGLALLAATQGRWQEAEEQYEHARKRALDWAEKPQAAWTAYDLAVFLRRRKEAGADPGDRRIEGLLQEALGLARILDMPGLVARTTALLEELRGGQAAGGPTVSLVMPGRAGHKSRGPGEDRADPGEAEVPLRLEQDGDMWGVTFRGRRFFLKGGRGIETLSRLVAEPGRDFHVLDLVGGEQAAPAATGDLGDSGALLDEQARQAYRTRLAAIEEELGQAQDHNDLGRVETLRAELEFLQAELGRAVGLGGRERRAGSATERARINVQRRIRETIRRMTEHDAALGRFLDRSVRTGALCRYDPE